MDDENEERKLSMMVEIKRYWTTASGEPELGEFAEYVLSLIDSEVKSHDQQITLAARIEGATAFRDQISLGMLGEHKWLTQELADYVYAIKQPQGNTLNEGKKNEVRTDKKG